MRVRQKKKKRDPKSEVLVPDLETSKALRSSVQEAEAVKLDVKSEGRVDVNTNVLHSYDQRNLPGLPSTPPSRTCREFAPTPTPPATPQLCTSCPSLSLSCESESIMILVVEEVQDLAWGFETKTPINIPLEPGTTGTSRRSLTHCLNLNTGQKSFDPSPT